MVGEIGFQSYLAAGLLLAGVVDDLSTRKVHNVLVLACLGIALVVTVLTPQNPLSQAFLTLGYVALLGLPLYFFGVIGGGDYKLMIAISPLVSFDHVFHFYVASLFWGALLGLFATALRGELKAFFSNLYSVIVYRQGIEKVRLQKIPFTVAIFFGFLSVMMGTPIFGA